MGGMLHNREIENIDLQDQIDKLMRAIPYCGTRDEALEMQEEIEELEAKIEENNAILEEVCPSCGSYELDGDPETDDLACGDPYHDDER